MENAANSDMHHQVGAVCALNGNVVSKGCNSGKRQRFNRQMVLSSHAELSVIWKVRRRTFRGKADIYVVRVLKDGTVGNARPCQECVNIMRCAGIRRVYYSTDEKTLQMEHVRTMQSTHLSIHQQRKISTGFKKWNLT